MRVPVRLHVNGVEEQLEAEGDLTLLDLLRNELKLFGTREACGIGLCGACTVLVDGTPVSSCIMLAWAANGKKVQTIEGLASGNMLHPVQEAFLAHNAFQCSYCTPGFILMAVALIQENPTPSREDIRAYLSGNLCRCGSYVKIEEAVLDAASRMDTSEVAEARNSGTPAAVEAGRDSRDE
jgi:aerobic-type carbon monoxide dehydrogenase small subunit (CoxS/CutS family)